MADVVYRVEFVAVDSTSKTKEQTPSNPEQKERMLTNEIKSTEEIAKKESMDTKKAFAKFMVAYGGYQIVNNIINSTQISGMMARGDNLKARIQSERNAQINSVVGSGLTLIGSAIIGGLPGLALAGGLEIYKMAQQSINIGIQNQLMISQLRAERHVANNDQERFVRNATTEKIRTW